jgi:pyruvate dehydrogenase E1 component beta subunit
MFSDFFAVCWDLVANEIAKSRYMSDGQVSFPLVIRAANGAGVRFGAQHSQSVENWAMAVPGPQGGRALEPPRRDRAARRRDPGPRPGALLRAEVAVRDQGGGGDAEIVEPLGRAKVITEGSDATILALAAMVPRAVDAARPALGGARHRL